MERDEILVLDDSALSARVKLEFSRGSGPGGQKRNKTSTAVRAVLKEYGISASDCTERSQHRNRAAALRKLRLELALRERRAPLPPPRTRCAVTSPQYPLFVARLLDALDRAAGDYRSVAGAWGVSPSSLLRTLERDPVLLAWLAARFPRFRVRSAAGGEDPGAGSVGDNTLPVSESGTNQEQRH